MILKRFLIAILAISFTSSSQAQSKIEGSLKADFVSSYIWRGLHLGHVSLQPELSVGWKGLSLTAWGNVGLSGHKDDNTEINLIFSYQTGGFRWVLSTTGTMSTTRGSSISRRMVRAMPLRDM